MFENVTVDQAISRGQKMVNLPLFALIFGSLGIGMYLAAEDYIPGYGVAIAFALGFVLGWIYWGIMITKWRIWAFTNVRNVHELQRKAVETKLIQQPGSFFEKTEIRTAAQKQQWAALQAKFSVQDVFQEDLGLPAETGIKYSRGEVSVMIAVYVAMIGGAIYLAYLAHYYWAVLVGGIGLYLLYDELKKLNDKSPQIILNDKGIETKQSGFTAWADITDDQVVTRTVGRSSNTYFEYDYPDGRVQLNIEELDTNKKALEDMLHTYRLRSEKKDKQIRETAID